MTRVKVKFHLLNQITNITLSCFLPEPATKSYMNWQETYTLVLETLTTHASLVPSQEGGDLQAVFYLFLTSLDIHDTHCTNSKLLWIRTLKRIEKKIEVT